jgi:phosphoserine phosphatase
MDALSQSSLADGTAINPEAVEELAAQALEAVDAQEAATAAFAAVAATEASAAAPAAAAQEYTSSIAEWSASTPDVSALLAGTRRLLRL